MELSVSISRESLKLLEQLSRTQQEPLTGAAVTPREKLRQVHPIVQAVNLAGTQEELSQILEEVSAILARNVALLLQQQKSSRAAAGTTMSRAAGPSLGEEEGTDMPQDDAREKSRTRQRYILVAVDGCLDLSQLGGGKESLMQAAVGRRCPAGVLSWFCQALGYDKLLWASYLLFLLGYCAGFFLELSGAQRNLTSLVTFISSLLIALANATRLNLGLLRRLLGSFDYCFLLLETILFSASLWSVLCFEPVRSIYCLGVALLVIFSCLSYDGFSSKYRRKMRYVYWVGLCLMMATLAGLYMDQRQDRCRYVIDLQALTVKREHEARSSWRIALYDFCLNRGLTLLMLLARLSWAAARSPNHTILLMSHYRLYESWSRGSAAGPRLSLGGNPTEEGSCSISTTILQQLKKAREGDTTLDDVCVTYLRLVAAAVEAQLKGPQEGVKQLWLMAIHGCEVLSHEQSTRSMLAVLLFGNERLSRWWVRHRQALKKASWVVQPFIFFTLYYAPFVPMKSYQRSLLYGLVLLCVLFNTLGVLWNVNARLLALTFRSMDAWLLLCEAILFCGSMWSVHCFALEAVPYVTSGALAISWWLVYDAYRNRFRKSIRWGYLPAWIGLVALWTLTYFFQQSEVLCLYELDLNHGVQLHSAAGETPLAGGSRSDDDEVRTSTSAGWRLSLFDFCLNRGMTLLVLSLKITISVFKNAKDSVVLGSYYRMEGAW